MPDFFDDPVVSVGVGLLVLSGLCAIAFYVVSNFRDYAVDDREDAKEMLANLREMHLKGDITDEEFRTIKAANHSHLHGATKNSDSNSSDDESNEPPDSPDNPTQP
ncbi:MAG: hypothetical protein HKN47_20990 [Pirellulaceae bacterium]|nr:hypothetical protein [Pirellulaceae bacterium]